MAEAPSYNICERFARRVDEAPGAIAVFDGSRSLTRAALDGLSDAIALSFPEGSRRIGVAMSHTTQMVATILGILKTGAAYVPVEPDFPEARIDYMMQNAQVDCIVTDDGIVAGPRLHGAEGVVLRVAGIGDYADVEAHKGWVRERSTASKDPSGEGLAYILYTSGTTGRPKGVMVTHANVCRYIDAFADEFRPAPGDVMMQHSVCSFDIFVEETFSALLAGMALAIPSADDMADIDSLMDFVRRTETTIISGFPYLLQEMNSLDELPPSLRLLISGGDILRARYVDKLVGKVKVYNTYGPSETTVCASYYDCSDGEPLDDGTYPIGKPVLGVQIRVVDENMRSLPEGEAGELVISGAGVSAGYVGDPPEQANFVTLEDGSRAYSSGDLGYMLPDGNLAFLHRRDAQVMIDGRRVEPTEVESVLCRCDGVASGVVRSYVDADQKPYLVAYYVPDENAAESHSAMDGHLRDQMAGQLAPYMVPEFFVSMLSLPLTPNGKIDTRALPRVWKAVG